MAISIALAEDNPINRNTFIQKTGSYKELDVQFIAVNGDDCLEKLNGVSFNQHPQVLFVDIEMPVLNGIQTIQIAKSLYPHIHYIVLTVFDDEEMIFEAIKAGASGYLLKDESAVGIRNAISNVMDYGGAPMSPAIARKALNMLSNAQVASSPVSNASEVDDFLSIREKEILQHTINGLDAKRIAQILQISVLTVRKHIANIYRRLHVNSKAEIIHLAHHRKWFN